MYLGEVRPVTLSIRDQDDTSWIPISASASVVDSDGEIVIEESTAYINGTAYTVTIIIDTTEITSTGQYEIIWKLVHTTYTYYHKTNLSIEGL